MIFKYSDLASFLVELRKKGRTVRFSDERKGYVYLLRHDVDFDIGLAHKLAEIEQEHGVVSTFFILVTSESYNPLAQHNKKLLKEMVEMGHEIGLHFDPTIYPADFLQEAVVKEAQILSLATGVEVKSISLHNPSIHGTYPIFNGFVNAYDKSIFSDESYISDSRMNFRGKDPFEWLEKIKHTTVQILLHPLHYTDEGSEYDAIFCTAFMEHMQRIHKSFIVNEKYKEVVGEDFCAAFKRHLKP